MFRKFSEIEDYIISNNIVKTIALACAQDEHALGALVNAKRKNIVKGVLIGDVDKIKNMLKEMKEKEEDYEFISCDDELECAKIAVKLVREKKADIPMKGSMMTSSFMRAILNKEEGLISNDNILSQASLLEFNEENRFMVISDCAVNINPDVDDKIKITNNAIKLAHILGIEKPNIGVLSALEKVNEKIQSTVDAKEVSEYKEFDNIGSIAGPLALDLALSKEAAMMKGVNSPVCGNADILIVPDLPSGNIFTKALVFFAHLKVAGTLLGTDSPVIMTSRSDTEDDKYLSILMAIFQAVKIDI